MHASRTVTGASTLCTLLSSIRISRALSHKALTSDSFKYSHFLSRSICSSRSEIDTISKENRTGGNLKVHCMYYFDLDPNECSAPLTVNMLGRGKRIIVTQRTGNTTIILYYMDGATRKPLNTQPLLSVHDVYNKALLIPEDTRISVYTFLPVFGFHKNIIIYYKKYKMIIRLIKITIPLL